MKSTKVLLRGAMVLAIAAGIVAPAGATTLRRLGLDFILTDVRIALHDALKGDAGGRELTVTIMGGEVGDRTVMIVGGPELVEGRSYVLFLNEENLPGPNAPSPSATWSRERSKSRWAATACAPSARPTATHSFPTARVTPKLREAWRGSLSMP
jgi:hypothetical protein